MIIILEPIITVKMNKAEAAVILKLLEFLPVENPKIQLDATQFENYEWLMLMDMYGALSDELRKQNG